MEKIAILPLITNVDEKTFVNVTKALKELNYNIQIIGDENLAVNYNNIKYDKFIGYVNDVNYILYEGLKHVRDNFVGDNIQIYWLELHNFKLISNYNTLINHIRELEKLNYPIIFPFQERRVRDIFYSPKEFLIKKRAVIDLYLSSDLLLKKDNYLHSFQKILSRKGVRIGAVYTYKNVVDKVKFVKSNHKMYPLVIKNVIVDIYRGLNDVLVEEFGFPFVYLDNDNIMVKEIKNVDAGNNNIVEEIGAVNDELILDNISNSNYGEWIFIIYGNNIDKVRSTIEGIRRLIDIGEFPYRIYVFTENEKIKGKVVNNVKGKDWIIEVLNNVNNFSGEYIVFLYEGVKIKNDNLYLIKKYFENDKDIGLITGPVVNDKGKILSSGKILFNSIYGAEVKNLNNEGDFNRAVGVINKELFVIKKEDIKLIDKEVVNKENYDVVIPLSIFKGKKRPLYVFNNRVIKFEDNIEESNENEINNIEDWIADILGEDYYMVDEFNKIKILDIDKYLKPVVGYVMEYIPRFDKSGGEKLIQKFLNELNKKYNVILFVLNKRSNGEDEPYASLLKKSGIEIKEVNYLIDNSVAVDYIITEVFKFVPDNLEYIWFAHDVHHLRFKSLYEETKDESKLNIYKDLSQIEKDLQTNAKWIITVSDEEYDYISSVTGKEKLIKIPVYQVDNVDKVNKPDFENTKDLLFVGSYQHEPNKISIEWFIKNHWGKIINENDNIRLNIVMSNIEEGFYNWLKSVKNVNVFTNISDKELEDIYIKSRFVIAPIISGAGVKVKIVEGIINQTPVITTDIGAQGINCKNILIIGDKDNLSSKILSVYDNKKLQKKLVKKYKECALKNYSKDVFQKNFNKLLKG